eukprot:snap_masked-scaffold_1-processed-gene-2.42-mRNA-1 protein AED:1.00 eAED:1.00 QI:0/-1/0/0/-1/1/1/0/62
MYLQNRMLSQQQQWKAWCLKIAVNYRCSNRFMASTRFSECSKRTENFGYFIFIFAFDGSSAC